MPVKNGTDKLLKDTEIERKRNVMDKPRKGQLSRGRLGNQLSADHLEEPITAAEIRRNRTRNKDDDDTHYVVPHQPRQGDTHVY